MATTFSLLRAIDVSKPLPGGYLSKGLYDPKTGNIKPELLNEIAFQKAYELLSEGVTSDALTGFNNHLRRLAFGADPQETPYNKEQKQALGESLKDAASAARQVDEFLAQAWPYIRHGLDLQAFSAHVQAVAVKLVEIEATRQLANAERAQDELEIVGS